MSAIVPPSLPSLTALIRRKGLEDVLDGTLDEFLERRQMNVREPLDVDACLTARMFAELSHQIGVAFEARPDVESDVLFAWGKCGQHPIVLATAAVFVAKTAETNNAGTPHLRLGFCGFLHDVCYRPAVFADLFVFDGVEKIINGRVIALCLKFGHRNLHSQLCRSPRQ